MHAMNLNLMHGAQPAKTRKFLHVSQKNPIGLRIMQGPTLYAQNSQMSLCSKVSNESPITVS